jgi:hypothetical protein
VRLNGRTIGNASSGGTELADASAQSLFNFLWGVDPTLVVAPGGRGVSAAADWAANKTLALPDGRSRLLGMLGGMGGADAGFWANAVFSKGNSITLGSLAGSAATPNCNVALGIANLPPYTPAGTITDVVTQNAAFNNSSIFGYPASSPFPGVATAAATISVASTFHGTPQGGTSTPFVICPPILLITVYMKT